MNLYLIDNIGSMVLGQVLLNYTMENQIRILIFIISSHQKFTKSKFTTYSTYGQCWQISRAIPTGQDHSSTQPFILWCQHRAGPHSLPAWLHWQVNNLSFALGFLVTSSVVCHTSSFIHCSVFRSLHIQILILGYNVFT